MSEISDQARLENALLGFIVMKFMGLTISLRGLIYLSIKDTDENMAATAIYALMEYHHVTYESEFRKFLEENYPGTSVCYESCSEVTWEKRWNLVADYFWKNLENKLEMGELIASINPPPRIEGGDA